MELIHTYQIDLDELKTEKIDCIIAASGFHSRCTYLAEKIDLGHSRKHLITFDDNDYANLRKENESVFIKLGFHPFTEKAKSGKEIEILLDKVCRNNSSGILNIIVDYSCMPKVWIATILDYISRNELSQERINLFFTYSPKQFLPNVKKIVDYIGPIIEPKDLIQNDENLTLMVGLDNHYDAVNKLAKDINPQRIYAFIPEPAFAEEYSKSVLKKNKPLLERIGNDNIIKYPAGNPEEINSKLTSLCLEMRLNSRIIIVPLGPKTFALTSLLLSLRYPDIKLWDITSKIYNYNPKGGKVSGEPVILKTVFCNDNEDE
ncbi:MAG: hypothetical protein JSV22_10155 [Bacteroidales bacterium]|nr:MAG: hypothetical protein JSV22_10155 [Bacteroidales bacterium]